MSKSVEDKFIITCTKCGSTDVTVTHFSDETSVCCKQCGSYTEVY